MNWRIVYIKSKNSCMLNKVNNFKIFRIFNKKFMFLFCELCKRVHNTFMVKIGNFIVYFKIMPFWVTPWPFKKVPYDVALACNYDISTVILWWCFCNAQLLYSEKPYCVRRVKWCSYDANCAWYNKILVILLCVIILIKCFQHLRSKYGWF